MDTFLQWWQHLPTHMDPEIFSIGNFRLQWYGLMYILAFVTTYLLAMYRIRTEERFDYDEEFLKSMLTYAFVGVLVGGRLGYVLFYNFGYYINHPLEIILPFDFDNGMRFTGISGMSYHGGLIGVMVACWLFVRKYKADYWNLADLFGVIIPLGYTFGRLGNFINGELYGRITEAPIGMYFPSAATEQLRHPSQLYEAFFEGVFLFALYWMIRKAAWIPRGGFAGLYLFGYGFVRFFIEYFRMPDEHFKDPGETYGFVLGNFSMGQLLCLAMMLAGVGFFAWRWKREKEAGWQPHATASGAQGRKGGAKPAKPS